MVQSVLEKVMKARSAEMHAASEQIGTDRIRLDRHFGCDQHRSAVGGNSGGSGRRQQQPPGASTIRARASHLARRLIGSSDRTPAGAYQLAGRFFHGRAS